MTTPFFSGASGDPTRSLRRLGRQTADGVPASSYVDFLHNGGPMSLDLKSVRRAALTGGSVRGLPLRGKLDVSGVGPLYMGDLNPNEPAQAALALSFFRGYKTTNPGSGDHYRHRLSDWLRSNGGGTQQLNKLSLIGDDDKGYATRVVDAISSGWSLRVAANQNVALQHQIAAGKVDLHGDATRTSGSGSVAPILRHFWDGNLDTADKDIYVTIVSDTATEVVFTVRVGASGSESASITATKGVWTRLYYSSSDLILGFRGHWVEAYFPTGSNGDFADGAIWKVPQRRARHTPSFATEVVVPEVSCALYVDGEEIPFDNGITITAKAETAETRYTATGVQPVGTFRAGENMVTIAVDRRYADLSLETKILRADVVSFVAEAYTDTKIGASSQDYGAAVICPYCRLTGKTFSAEEGGRNRNEALTLEAALPPADLDFTWDGLTVEADCEMVIDTGFATLT